MSPELEQVKKMKEKQTENSLWRSQEAEDG